jgi:hypothetical protein
MPLRSFDTAGPDPPESSVRSRAGAGPVPERLHAAACWAMTCVLLILALAYYARGANYLVWGKARSDAVDLRMRWSEEQYFLRGQNPYDMWLAHSPSARRAGLTQDTARRAEVAPDLGTSDPAHPPWAYVTGLLLLWPKWPAVRVYYLLLNTIGLIVIAVVAAALVDSRRREVRWLAASGALAMGSVSATLGVGQYGIIVVALLAAALWFAERRHWARTGLLLALSLVKPTLSGPFCLVPWTSRRWTAAAAMAGYLVVASGVTWLVVGVNPVVMLMQLHRVGAVFGEDGNLSAAEVLFAAGVDRQLATSVALVVVIVPACLALFALRSASPVVTFAVAAVAARFWSYHKSYDNLVLVFVLIALARLWSEAPAGTMRKVTGLTWLAMGITLWVPPRATTDWQFLLVQLTIWLVAIGLLVSVALWRRSNDARAHHRISVDVDAAEVDAV